MRISRRLVCVSALAAFASFATPAALSAQHTKPSPGRVAGIAPPPAQVPQRAPRPHVRGSGYYGRVPVVLLSDGRAFADFGRGYEQVVQSCGLPGAALNQGVTPAGPVQPVVVQPTVTQPGIPGNAPLPYTPPVPVQQAAPQQAGVQGTASSGGLGQSCALVRVGGQLVGIP